MNVRIAILCLLILSSCVSKQTQVESDALVFKDLSSGELVTLAKGNGYVIAYVDLAKDCSSCLRAMVSVHTTVSAYDDITFLLINKGKQGLDDIEEKVGVIEYQVLEDPHRSIERYLHLKSEPMLLIFDRELLLISAFRLIDLNAITNLNKHCHAMLQSI